MSEDFFDRSESAFESPANGFTFFKTFSAIFFTETKKRKTALFLSVSVTLHSHSALLRGGVLIVSTTRPGAARTHTRHYFKQDRSCIAPELLQPYNR
jgi:hypothetical protein